MSKMGMLGLLEGLGKGITSTGQAMEKMNLQQAEEQRKMNLARIQRDWANQDEDTRYQRNLTDQERLTKENREYQEGQDIVKRAQTVADQERALKAAEDKEDRAHKNRLAEIDHQGEVTAENQRPTELDKKMEKIAELKEKGLITDAEEKAFILGTQRTSAFTAKDLADFKLKSLEQATLEIRGKDPLQATTPEEKKAIDKRAREIYGGLVDSVSGGGGGGLLESPPAPAIDLHPKMKNEIAAKLASASPEQIPAATKQLQAKGLSDAQVADVIQEAKVIREKREGAKNKAVEDKQAGLEKAQRGEGVLSEGAYRIINDMPAAQETAPPAEDQQLNHRQRRDRQSFSGQAPWLQQ